MHSKIDDNNIETHIHNDGVREENSQQLSILLQKAIGIDNSPSFTKEQVDELLSQRREVTKYIHEDKKRESNDSKFYFIAGIVFILTLSGFVLWKKPEFFQLVLAFLSGLFGGGIGGYGFAKMKS